MWLEAILSEADITALVRQLLPVKLLLGEDGSDDRWLHLARPESIELVPNTGIRIVTRAKVRWSVAGVHVPITVDPLIVMLRPEVQDKTHLGLALAIEDADLKGIPTVLDRAVASAVNGELAKRALAVDFGQALSHAFALPKSLPPLEALDLQALWGEVKVTPEGLAFAVSFRAEVRREGLADEAVHAVDGDELAPA